MVMGLFLRRGHGNHKQSEKLEKAWRFKVDNIQKVLIYLLLVNHILNGDETSY